jgi:hypothetical protein
MGGKVCFTFHTANSGDPLKSIMRIEKYPYFKKLNINLKS